MDLPQSVAFVLSLAIEAIAAALLLRATRWASAWRGALAALVGTGVTHPFVWWGVTTFEEIAGYWPAVATAELFAVAVETVVWRLIAVSGWLRALICAAIANALSFAFGLAIYFWM